jgi:Bacterial Ig-like domain (group 3)
MITDNSTRRCIAIAMILGAAALTIYSSSPATSAEAGGLPSAEPAQPAAAAGETTKSEQQARKAWGAEMSKRPLPKIGCFTASYPSTEWQEVQCGPPSTTLNLVGHGNDFVAATSGLISSATGSFLSGSSASGETGNAGGQRGLTYSTTDMFTLQINTQNQFNEHDGSTFNSSACDDAPEGKAGCSAWEQFLFSQAQGPAPDTTTTPPQVSAAPGAPHKTTPEIFIQYWLYNYGMPCPTTAAWISLYPHCVYNSPAQYVPPQSVAGLAPTDTTPGTVMTGTAGASMDSITLTTPTGAYGTAAPSLLKLSKYWTEAEFNILGDGSDYQAIFASPTVLLVKTSVDATSAPFCVPNDGTTGETNNLTFVPTAAPVCCKVTGAIEFMEALDTSHSHNASCSGTSIEGDPHLTTADGTHFDFQGAGEFISLRDPDGMEIQTRQTPISTTFFPAPNAYDGLATCVSINTAVAARVGGRRVTWEPNLSGVPDPSGLQLRIDGALATLGPQGRALGSGGRIAPAAGGALEVDFPDGKTLMATPTWWASQSKWYLNVDVSRSGIVSDVGGASARGIAGAIAEGSWLPALPNGASIGPMPASLAARYDTLYEKFADAWRVNDKDSLFDYAPGASTDTFTMKDWPKQDPPCNVRDEKPVEPASEAEAIAACRQVKDENRRADCVFDVRATGNLGFAQAYSNTQRNLALSTTTSLADGDNPSQPGEWVIFTAFVAPYSTVATGLPSGTVQFAVDGSNSGEPITVDAKGRARWETSRLKIGASRVTAAYLPDTDSAFLPSTSLEKIHEVRRCACGEEHKVQ